MGYKQKYSDSFQISNDIHNLFVCHNSANRSFLVECVVKVNIFILLNRINILHVSFQLESLVLLPFITGWFIHEPLVVIFAVYIYNAIVFCDGDTWCSPPNNHICWNNRVYFNVITHRTSTWRTCCTTSFIQPSPNQQLSLLDVAYSSFGAASIFPLKARSYMNNIW